jgi:chemotaxis protein MotB
MHVPKPLSKPEKADQAVVKRVRRRKGEEGHSTAWKIAFADFCLALLCLFLVMWLMAVRQAESLQDLLKAAGGRMFDEGRGRMSESLGGPRGSLISREPLPSDGDTLTLRKVSSGLNQPQTPESSSRPAPTQTQFESAADLAELAAVLARLGQETGLASNLQWMITPYGLRVTLHDTDRQGMFEVGSSQPTERFGELLHQMGPLFSRVENQMLIVGHTDSRRYADHGPEGMSNWRLSSDRAMAARSYLLAGGMSAGSVLQVVGLADGSPLNADDPGAAANRRIEFLILTRAQARNISAMFGAPDQAVPLIDGVETSMPDREALDALRGQLGPSAQ